MSLVKYQRIDNFINYKWKEKNKLRVDNELIKNLDKLHTTELGLIRIKRNLSLDTNNLIEWCKTKIESADAIISQRGKNWYVNVEDCIITVNASSYTIITAHKDNGN